MSVFVYLIEHGRSCCIYYLRYEMGPINRSVTYHDDVHFLDISYLRLTLPTQDNILYKLDT